MDKAGDIQRAGSRSSGLGEPAQARWTEPFMAGLLLVTAVAVVAAGLVAAFQTVHSDAVFPGVRVGDVMVGGMSRQRAFSELEPLYQQRAAHPLLVRIVGMERQVAISELGARLDAAAAVNAAYAVGRTGGWPERLSTQFRALVGGYSVDSPGISIDRSRLQAFVAEQARQVDRPVKDAELVIGEDLSVKVTPSVIGRQMETAGAYLALERAIMTGASSVELPVTETAPRRREQDLEAARAQVATMLSGAAALEFEGRRWELSPREIRALLSVEFKEGLPTPVVSLKEEPLKRMVDRIATEIDQPKVNARYDWNGGNLKLLRPGQDGRKVEAERALVALKEAISSDRRVVPLPVTVEKAAGGSIDPSQLNIKEQIEFGRTIITGVPEKVHNIKLAASRLNGVLVGPGELFSFNKELGPTTLKAGYQVGFGIAVNNGEMQTVPSVAGGICQVATTLLHAVFWAGYQIEERFPHMYWIANYGLPPRGLTGLDATVDDPFLDFKFVNNTENYLLIQSRVEGNNLEFILYGTKPNWKVEVEGPHISNVVKADQKTVRQEEPSWPVGRELWVEKATDGMDVELIRRVIVGDEVRTLNLKSRYQPSRNVLMVGTKKPDPTPTPTATPGPGAPAPAPQPQAPTPVPTPGGQ